MMSDWQYGEFNCFVGGKKPPKNTHVMMMEESIVITDIQIQNQDLNFPSSMRHKGTNCLSPVGFYLSKINL